MLTAIHTALSGLAAYAKHVEVIAHNVANSNTDKFKGSHTEFVSVETGGVLPVVRNDDPIVLSDRGDGPSRVELSNVDLAEETVNLILAQRGFNANLNTLKTADDMLGTILDMKR